MIDKRVALWTSLPGVFVLLCRMFWCCQFKGKNDILIEEASAAEADHATVAAHVADEDEHPVVEAKLSNASFMSYPMLGDGESALGRSRAPSHVDPQPRSRAGTCSRVAEGSHDLEQEEDPPPAALKPRPESLLGPALRSFKAAAQDRKEGDTKLPEVQRVSFIEGLCAYAKALDALGGNMGSYVTQNVDKLSRSKASSSSSGYREWLLSELPMHAATGYKGYLDDSAWMANLWIGWTLEFWMEFWAELHKGSETKQSAALAYKRSLTHHHNMFQRAGFNSAVGRMPSRAKLLELIAGDAEAGVDVIADLGELVDVGWVLVEFCLRVNAELDHLLQQARKKGKV